MTDKYALPDYATSRVRYYNGQLLADDDFIFDQAYHIAHQRRHERLLHVAGVTEGLAVTLASGNTVVEVAPGSAIDTQGRQILLPAKQSLPAPTVDGTSYVEIAFSEVETTPAAQNSIVQGNTRLSQPAAPASIKTTKTAGSVLLATLVRASGVLTVNLAERAYSGLRLPGPAGATGALRSRGDASPGWAELGCSLSVTGSATVSGSLGVGGASSPRTALDTGTGVMSGSANDYTKAQFAMSGGGSVSWVNDRLKWTTRFLCIGAERGVTFPNGFVDIAMPAGPSLPAAQVWDNTARSIDGNGILLQDFEALYAVHTLGGANNAYQLRIQRYTNAFHAPSNWILVAVRNGDDNSLKLGTGAVIPAGRTLNEASPFRVTQVLNQSTGSLPKSGSFTSNGNTLLIFVSGSAYGPATGAIGMNISIDGVVKGTASIFTNEINSHKSFVNNALVVTGIGAGSHTLSLAAWGGTATDVSDIFTATVLEMPF